MRRGVPPASDSATLRRMQRQKQSDTRAELFVRSLLHNQGHRFRVANRDLPGSPDAANRSRRWAVFVHGCYWHQHPGCPRATIPRRNRDFWKAKFQANRERDERVEAQLREAGYAVIRVWECEIDDPMALAERLRTEVPD